MHPLDRNTARPPLALYSQKSEKPNPTYAFCNAPGLRNTWHPGMGRRGGDTADAALHRSLRYRNFCDMAKEMRCRVRASWRTRSRTNARAQALHDPQ